MRSEPAESEYTTGTNIIRRSKQHRKLKINEQESIKSRGDQSPPPELPESPLAIHEVPAIEEQTGKKKLVKSDSSEVIEVQTLNNKPI